MIVLDTTAVSHVMRRSPAHLARLQVLEPWQVVLCAPVAAEIHFGLARLDPGSRRRCLLEQEYRRLRGCAAWADWSEDAAVRFGSFKAALQAAGTPVDDMDLAVASIAASLGAPVATANVRHFARVPGLEVADWSEESEAHPS